MGIVSSAMLIVSGVYLASGLVYLRFWLDKRSRRDYLAFSLFALSITLVAWFELGALHSQTPEEYLFYAWWNFLNGVVVTLALAWFAYVYLRGRSWLFWTYCALRLVGVVVHLILPNGINFREITSVGRVNVLGEALSYPIAVPSEWMILSHLSHILLLVFCLDASIGTWRRGERRKALVFGTGVVLSRVIASIVSIGVLWGSLQLPFFASFSIIFVIAATLYELNYDMHRAAMAETEAAKLGGRLSEIVASVPGIVWESRTESGAKARKTTFISDYVQKLSGYTPEEWITEQPGLQVVPEEDRERVVRESDEVIKSGKEAVSEFRWITKDGRIRWVENHLSPIVDQEAGIVGLRGVALDVTERHTAEQALRESESFNRTILSSLNTHVCVLDRDGRIISVNHAWAAFALDNGSASEASVGPGVSYLDVCRKATEGAALAQVVLDGVKAVCDGTKEYFQLEYPCHSPTEKRWFLMTVTPLKGDKGGAVVVHNDITDRELAAEAARESKARLAETLDQLQLSAAAANVGMWTRKVGEGMVWLSEKAVDVWGFPSGMQVRAEDIFQRVHPDDREPYLTNIREVEEWKNDYQIEYRFLSPDESIRWIHSRGKVEEVDGSRIIRGAIVDITELKMVEARLTDTLDQLQLAAAAGNVGMWTRKIGDDKLWLSEKAGDILGLPKAEQFSREEFYQHIHPSDRAQVFTLAQEFEDGKTEFQLEYRILLKDGNVRWVHSRGKVEEVDGSRIIRGAIVDITKLKLAEEAVRELNHKLINAQEKERARLARELHDDLSQRIALFSIRLSILRQKTKDLEYFPDELDQLISDVNHLSKDVRRISHELHPAKLKQLGLEVALKDFCCELAAAHPLHIDFKAENLSRDLPDDIALCLYRVTQESLQNVIKHSAASSAQVSIELQDGAIRLSVSDNGTGFDSDAKTEKEALGLLSIDERVRAVKGHAKIISAVGKGTKVEVQIPISQAG